MTGVFKESDSIIKWTTACNLANEELPLTKHSVSPGSFFNKELVQARQWNWCKHCSLEPWEDFKIDFEKVSQRCK